MDETVILTASEIAEIIDSHVQRIHRENPDTAKFAIVGLQRGGVQLARRIREKIEALSGTVIQSGTLDITFYRDDLATRGVLPAIRETHISFDISTMTVLLVDDVIFTGRTVKAALETLTSFGRPRAIRLFVLVDRGNRELPIQPDYTGYTVATYPRDTIDVILGDDPGGDRVILRRG